MVVGEGEEKKSRSPLTLNAASVLSLKDRQGYE